MPAKLTENDYQNAAKSLGVPVAAVKAIKEVESSGSGFLPTGVPKILFERHVMYRSFAAKFGERSAEIKAAKYPDIINKVRGGYGKESEQPGRMDRAAQIDRECALESASWGLFQIMGYHWRALSYPTLQAFVNAMYSGEGGQLDAFVRFVKNDAALHQALKRQDWADFAFRYNGSAYRENRYDEKLAAAFKQAGGVGA